MRIKLPFLLSFAMLASSGLGAEQPNPPKPDEADAAAPGREAVRQVVETYGQAIETQDVELFRSVMPRMSADSEKRLRDSFKGIRSQRVGITIRSVDVDHTTATVRVLREDTVDGRRMKPLRQEFRLARQDDRWWIQSLSVDR